MLEGLHNPSCVMAESEGWRKGKFVATLEASAIVLVRSNEGQGVWERLK